jgi:hypothetical protein
MEKLPGGGVYGGICETGETDGGGGVYEANGGGPESEPDQPPDPRRWLGDERSNEGRGGIDGVSCVCCSRGSASASAGTRREGGGSLPATGVDGRRMNCCTSRSSSSRSFWKSEVTFSPTSSRRSVGCASSQASIASRISAAVW